MPSRKPARSRPKTYEPGDRVQPRRAYGVVGHVVEVIRRSKPAFFGYLVRMHGGNLVELAGTDVVEPPRLLLEEYRRWEEDLLGWEYIALLDDARLAQLRMEWIEVHKTVARLRPDWIPHRRDGVAPVHRVTITKTSERYEAFSSNGAHLRLRERHYWWLRCPCGFHEVVESSKEARRRKGEHDTPSESSGEHSPRGDASDTAR
ncbi:hypothetical protein [Nonomuraea sp. NPDC049028]|uniref:hypothetical protein n=1 Tax=Nonomuraea sp. NPDC049028 TaxID=3364348 RepID=UPI00371E5FDE